MKEAAREYIYSETRVKDIQPQPIHRMAVFLHPAFKSLHFCDLEEKGKIHDHARLEIGATSDENANISCNNTNASLVTNESGKSNSLFDEFLSADDSQDDVDATVSDEVERYINLKIEKVLKLYIYDFFLLRN